MCTKWFSAGEVHKYFNPYGSPYEAFINYMNVLSDFMIRVDENIGSLEKVKIESEKPAKKEAKTKAVSEKVVKKVTKKSTSASKIVNKRK